MVMGPSENRPEQHYLIPGNEQPVFRHPFLKIP
jgi:hypothetical protein